MAQPIGGTWRLYPSFCPGVIYRPDVCGTIYQPLFVGVGFSITAITVQAVMLHTMRTNKSKLDRIKDMWR
ncbi:MAG: hypothetical protein SV375_03085 [Thermodesulfobacteriota bacterium]|nr:hypothetical protein [Thermodesulfobacteriota bacterium]